MENFIQHFCGHLAALGDQNAYYSARSLGALFCKRSRPTWSFREVASYIRIVDQKSGNFGSDLTKVPFRKQMNTLQKHFFESL